jgi:hypothetical protein
MNNLRPINVQQLSELKNLWFNQFLKDEKKLDPVYTSFTETNFHKMALKK